LASFAHRGTGGHRASAIAFVVLLCCVPVAYAATKQPIQVLVGVAALVLIVACTLRIELAVLLLVATAPLEFAISFGTNSQLTITKLAGVVCFGAFAINAIVTQRRLIFDITHGLVFVLLGIALVSMVQADELAFAVVKTTRYASFVALFFVVSQFVGAHGLQRGIAWTLSIASSITGLLASWNFLSGATVSGYVGPGGPGSAGDIAFILATTLPLTMWLLRERGLRRLGVAAMIAIIAVSILLTLSRGALVGIGAGLVWYTLFERRNARALIVGAVVIGVALFAVIRLESHSIETGLQAKGKVASTNVEMRLQAWTGASRLAISHPVVGVGPGNFQFHYHSSTGTPPGTRVLNVVHNAYLDVAAELGLVALAVFLAYLALVFIRLATAVRYQLGPPGFASALRVSFVIAVVSALTLSEQYFAPFWLIGGLAVALAHERVHGGATE
jgi:putative inorganic carbon (HCO3(-)) transporter